MAIPALTDDDDEACARAHGMYSIEHGPDILPGVPLQPAQLQKILDVVFAHAREQLAHVRPCLEREGN